MLDDNEAMPTQDAELIARRSTYRKLFTNKYQNWVSATENASTFVRGTHFEGGNLRSTGSTDTAPEDRYGEERDYFAVPYVAMVIDEMVQYVRGEDVPPSVEAEEVYNFPSMSPELKQVMELARESFKDLSDNEIYAKMLTARLDLYSDRAQMERLENEILNISAMERVTGVYVSHYEDESTKEPIRVEICQPGNFGFDPDAAKIEEGRFCWYTERSLDRKAVQIEYDVELEDSSVNGSIRTDDRTDLKGLVDIEHWWYRDTTTENKENEDSSESVYKYQSGWRYVVYCNGKVIYDGQPKVPLGWGKPPLLTHCYRPMPRTIMGMSLYDLTKDQNQALDRFMQYAVKTAERQQPKNLIDSNRVEDIDRLAENEVGDWTPIDVKSGESLSTAIQYMQGGAPSTANIDMYERVKRMTSEMCGIDGIKLSPDLPRDASGVLAEGLLDSKDGVAGAVRDNWTWFRKDLYTLIAMMLIDYADEPVTVKLQTPMGPINVPLAERAFNITSDSYEARFDIVVQTPRNVPRNPVKRAQYWLSILRTVAEQTQADPALAMLYVQTSDLPNKAQLIEYIQQKQAQAQAQPQGGTGNEQGAEIAAEMAKMQAKAVENEQEARLKVQSRAAETVTDILEEAGKTIAKSDPMGAVAFSQEIPELVKRAFEGEQINIQQPQAIGPQAQPIPEGQI